MSLTGKLGFVLAATGAAHFVVPDLFTDVTAVAFPNDTDAWVRRNGGCESVIGTAMMLPPTRKAGVLGLLGYLGWLGYNAVNAAD